jgi:hypothetical protein
MKYFLQTRAAAAVTALVMAMSAAASVADDSEKWQYDLRINLWLPSISGDLRFSDPDSGGSVDVDPDEILKALNTVFMGSFEARRGKVSGFTDVVYLDLSGDKSKSVAVRNGATLTLFDADLKLKGFVWTLAGAYSVWRSGKSHLDVLGGARLFSLDADVDLTGGGPLQNDRKLSDSVDLWDVIVGVRGRAAVSDRWFLPYYLDVGTGDANRTWQAAFGFGYAFRWGEAGLTYRYLEYEQGDDELVQELAFGGPMASVGFRF